MRPAECMFEEWVWGGGWFEMRGRRVRRKSVRGKE